MNEREPKTGWKTTEFWIAVLVIVCATALVLAGKIDKDGWQWAVGLVGGGYAIARGITKV